jgi:hypothetical protein
MVDKVTTVPRSNLGRLPDDKLVALSRSLIVCPLGGLVPICGPTRSGPRW